MLKSTLPALPALSEKRSLLNCRTSIETQYGTYLARFARAILRIKALKIKSRKTCGKTDLLLKNESVVER